MSILIKGMEMPINCYHCSFLDYEEGYCFASGVKHESGWYECTLCPGAIKDKRHEKCPLIPVLPHGRLIDADALRSKFREPNKENGGWRNPDEALVHKMDVWAAIDAVPTIIEAEEGE